MSKALSAGGPTAAQQGIAVGAVGGVISVLLLLVLWEAAGTRDRALVLADEKTEELEFLTLHDDLTGLPNRALVLDRLDQVLARPGPVGADVALLLVDLDDFKGVNDTLGHRIGDELLRGVAARISAVLRDSDTLARVGGDEFLVLLDGPAALGGPELVAQRIVDVLVEPFPLGATTLPVRCSVGIATGRRSSAEALLRDADLAVHEAKALG